MRVDKRCLCVYRVSVSMQVYYQILKPYECVCVFHDQSLAMVLRD